mmetsp:Transcript_12010/g.19301  ORF Transcript_12010/g.19301 Transcript_12010/m.19301 type:complete len:202 (+) Transcript_12010:84-689(+)
MSYTYEQSTGILRDENGSVVGRGYSGYGSSKNKPGDESKGNAGPIPRGEYKIGSSYHSTKCGPVSIRLTPDGHSAHGRTDFLVHGDNSTHTASRGCIIMPRDVRTKIVNGSIKSLRVVETYQTPSSSSSTYTSSSWNSSYSSPAASYSSYQPSSSYNHSSSQWINDQGIGNDRVRVHGGFDDRGGPQVGINVSIPIPCLIL